MTVASVYSAGSIERGWDGVPQQQACERAQRDAFSAATLAWLNFASSTQQRRRVQPMDASLLGNLSTFTWPASAEHPSCTELIEPLTGMARHPLAANNGCWLRHAPAAVREVPMKQTTKYDTGHIIFTSRCDAMSGGGCAALGGRRFAAARSLSQPRNLLFDMGCAAYGRHVDEAKTMFGGIKPSLPLLQAIYRRSGCITFDAIWAWEARPQNPQRWWRDDLRCGSGSRAEETEGEVSYPCNS